MTLDEFLDDYVPRVLRPMGGWHLRTYGRIRNAGDCCPLTAEAGRFALERNDGIAQGLRLGLAVEDAERVITAADGDWPPEDLFPPEPAIRARLLAGLGLTEETR